MSSCVFCIRLARYYENHSIIHKACYSILVSLPRSKTECPSVSAAFLKSRKMSQGNVFLSRIFIGIELEMSRIEGRDWIIDLSWKCTVCLMGELILLHASRFQLFITFSKIRLKKEKMKGNFMVFTSVDCIDEFMSRNNYASLTHQIADRGPFLESPDN